MSKRKHTRQADRRPVVRDATARVRRGTFNRISAVAHANRMNVIDVFDTLMDAWDRMTPEEKQRVIQRETVSEADGS